jgi:opacity protein-like surface antigen
MRKLFILFGFMLFVAGSAKAQAQGFEVSGNYQFVRISPGGGNPSSNCQGAAGTAAVNLNNWLGVVGDFGGCKVTGLPTGAGSHEMNYLFGPRLSYHSYGRFTPYVQSLFGGERLTASATGFPSQSINSFAMTVGGGADFTVTRHLAFRAIQVEYLYTHFSGAKQNNVRIESALVYRWGGASR